MNAVRRLLAALVAVGFTLAAFLVLPLIQAIATPRSPDLELRSVDSTELPPPPPPPEEEPPPEPELEEPPPELEPEMPPLDLAQLELALSASGIGEGLLGGDFAITLGAAAGGADGIDDLVTTGELDQLPRPIYQVQPVMTAELRRKAPATVRFAIAIGLDGRIEDATVIDSTDPAFERAALAAIRQWRYEPGRRKGQPARFLFRQPITFPKSSP